MTMVCQDIDNPNDNGGINEICQISTSEWSCTLIDYTLENLPAKKEKVIDK